MELRNDTTNNTLWSRTFITVAAANFLLFFSFYQLLPILPLFILDKFQTDNATAGFIILLPGGSKCRSSQSRYTFGHFSHFRYVL